MHIEDFFNRPNIVDLSFFNFDNAITAAYFADEELRILKVNANFKKFFPVLGNVTNAPFPDLLEQLGIPGTQITDFLERLKGEGTVLIPQIRINVAGEERMFSLLSTRTRHEAFSYLNGVQGQFVDRTAEWTLRREHEELMEQKVRDREVIEEKSLRLESLATRLAKYLSPQIYKSIFSESDEERLAPVRKNLTVFMSDIVQFTNLTDALEPERLAIIINSYLSEMSAVALDCGGTIDKFIGDAVLVFFGDPESEGETEDALKAVEMALRMKMRIAELQKYWRRQGASQGLHVRMGMATGFCTVGNFGSEQLLEYTALGAPVNLAARLQSLAEPDTIVIDETTQSLVASSVDTTPLDPITPKGFSRELMVYRVEDFRSDEHRERRRRLSHSGKRVEVNVIDSSNIRAAIEELRKIQQDFEDQFSEK
ncbi:adenylate/guanylate cyclase domain-containing protein [Mesorhizobium sp. 10J20-29]